MTLSEKYAAGAVHHSGTGLEYKVIECASSQKATIKFTATGYEMTTQLSALEYGAVKDKLHPFVCGVGFIGVGENSKTKGYTSWLFMLKSCYGEVGAYHKGVRVVCDEWLNFQNFINWYKANSIGKLQMAEGETVYCPENCTPKEEVPVVRVKTKPPVMDEFFRLIIGA